MWIFSDKKLPEKNKDDPLRAQKCLQRICLELKTHAEHPQLFTDICGDFVFKRFMW